MNASKTLRPAFWALLLSFGMMILLALTFPELEEAIVAARQSLENSSTAQITQGGAFKPSSRPAQTVGSRKAESILRTHPPAERGEINVKPADRKRKPQIKRRASLPIRNFQRGGLSPTTLHQGDRRIP